MSPGDQARAALAVANEVRANRKDLKAAVKGDPDWKVLRRALLTPANVELDGRLLPERDVAGMRAFELLLAAYPVGKTKAAKLLTAADVPPSHTRSITVRQLGDRRRINLARILRANLRQRQAHQAKKGPA